MKTFHLQTLGCKVNHYESEQIASLLRSRGLAPSSAADADLRIINSCSVTVQAASQSRQETRRMVRLAVLSDCDQLRMTGESDASLTGLARRSRVIVMGCWATSDSSAAALPGVDAVLTHQDNLAAELDRLLTLWGLTHNSNCAHPTESQACEFSPQTKPKNEDQSMDKAASGAGTITGNNKAKPLEIVNENAGIFPARTIGANTLPLLHDAQPGRRRAFLKVQDGCDAHCTYCIIPRLRPSLYSKSIEDAVYEAKRLVDSGHIEIVLTGIFLGAYGQSTALRRRRPVVIAPISRLVDALCRNVPGLRRLRLSSLEPGDLTEDLIACLASHEQVVPHFHLPLQSGSDRLLRKMNRQYGQGDFLKMVERIKTKFDRPALTTDVIVAFPGETDADFQQTVDVVAQTGFIHVHAFPFSARPGTAAARWTGQFVHGSIANQRIAHLQQLVSDQSFYFRTRFCGTPVQIILEGGKTTIDGQSYFRGRSERYFMVHIAAPDVRPGDLLSVNLERITPEHSFGALRAVMDRVGDAERKGMEVEIPA